MTRPPPLPVPVPFPVYGLDPSFTGARNLIGWDSQEWLRTVTLLFRMPPLDGRIIIETLRKRSPSPAPLAEAALNAVIRATSDEVRGREAKQARSALIEAETQLIDLVDEGVVLRDWTATSVVVSGEPAAAHERPIGELRAVVLDLPEVVLSITASADVDLAEVRLIDVHDYLGEYRWPSIRERMGPRRDPPPPPSNHRLDPLYVYLSDIYAYAVDDDTDPRELLSRIEYVADAVLHHTLPQAEKYLS